ncbi:MAG TPA: hypothetical protein VFH68_15335 [Polyangia bacterium]|nr:hypothetical protein [Polyangia bacterium]
MLPSAHVARLPPTQDFCPCVQLLVQVREHLALGALPEHDCGVAHGMLDETNGQESVSTAQVATVWLSWHTVPAPVQTDAAQVQVAVPADTVHVWCVPHVFVVIQAAHPLGCT